MVKSIATLAYYAITLPILAGFYFHESDHPEILTYRYVYFFILISVTLFFTLLLPYSAYRLCERYGVKKLLFSIIPATALLILIYLFFHYKFYHNQKHLFDPYLQIHKPAIDLESYTEDQFIILALGGSTTLNPSLPLEAKHTFILEKELQKSCPSIQVRVINAGMDWYTSKHSLINYITYYRKVKPDAVIIMHAINDICRSFSPPDFSSGEYNDDYSHFYGPSFNAAVPATFEKKLLSPIMSFWFSSCRKMKEFNYEITDYKSIDAFRYNLRTLIKCIKQDGAWCILVEQRSIYKNEMNQEELNSLWLNKSLCNDGKRYAGHQSLSRAMNAFNEAARKIAVSENASFIEVGNKLESNLEFFADDVHYTARGSYSLAMVLLDYFRSNGIFACDKNPQPEQ